VEPLEPFVTPAMLQGMDRFWRLRAWRELQALPAAPRERVLPYLREWAAAAAGLSGDEVFVAHAQFAAVRDASVAATAPFDFVLSPVSPVPAFDAHLPGPTNDPAHPLEHIAFTVPFNMSEQPALALPAGMTADGLPVGLQIAGRRHDDAGVLRLGAAWEWLRDPLPPWPEVAA
jgi:aspartyl-tRNA(Asn)/glutamyl-tRNA(Gln) amidotransferase subunit A